MTRSVVFIVQFDDLGAQLEPGPLSLALNHDVGVVDDLLRLHAGPGGDLFFVAPVPRSSPSERSSCASPAPS